jgi:hypothetical protein
MLENGGKPIMKGTETEPDRGSGISDSSFVISKDLRLKQNIHHGNRENRKPWGRTQRNTSQGQ